MAIDAYTRYAKMLGAGARDLYICGSGECEEVLRRQAESLGDKIKFCGFVQTPEVARILGSTLALILPSTEEQWGLVINEAVAMSLPILCSMNVGARDLLVRSGVNGYIYEPDNPAGDSRVRRQSFRLTMKTLICGDVQIPHGPFGFS